MVFPRSRAFGAMPAECARWLAGQLNRPPMPGGSGRAGKWRGWDGITLPQETAFSCPSSGASQLFFLHHPVGAGVCLLLAGSQGITPARTKRDSPQAKGPSFLDKDVYFFSPMVPVNLETQATEHSIMEFACRWVSSYNHRLLLGRKAMTELESRLKSRDITLPTKVCRLREMVFAVVTYGCESWAVKKAERQRSDAFELWCWRRPSRVPIFHLQGAWRVFCSQNIRGNDR